MFMTANIEFYLDKIGFYSSPAAKLAGKLLLEKEELIKKHLKSHPSCCELLQNVFELGAVSVEFCDPSEITGPASWSVLSRKIRISTDVKDPFPLLEAFILKLCNAKNPEIESIIINLSQFSTLRDYLALYPNAENFANKHSERAHTARNLTTQIYQSGLENYKWPASRTGAVRTEQTFEEYFASLKTTIEEVEGLTRYDYFKKQYLEGGLFIIDANKKRSEYQIQQNQKILLICTETLIEMKKIIQTTHEILGIKKGEIVYTESERTFQEYEIKVDHMKITVQELKNELLYLEEKESEFKQSLEILKVKAIKALPHAMHIVTKIEIMARIKSWFENYNKLERSITRQQREKLNETFVKIQSLALELEKLDAIKLDNELKVYEEEISTLMDTIQARKGNIFQRLFSCFGKSEDSKMQDVALQKK